MNVNWVISPDGNETGNLLGYATANAFLRKALRDLGVCHDKDAKVALHFMFPTNFAPVRGAKNILFTMFEGIELPMLMGSFAPAFAKCDAVVVPSQFCADLFGPYTDKPIYVCPLGVDLENFPYRRRTWDNDSPFILGYVGAPNPRKFTILGDIAEHVIFPLAGRVQLYIKTTGAAEEIATETYSNNSFYPDVEETDYGKIYRGPLATVDTRKIPRHMMSSVYEKLHALFFCHAGEGWGLTGLEAMASGCPLIVSDWSGTKEYATSENSFPVETTMRDLEVTADGGELRIYTCGYPSHESAADRICEVITDYGAATAIAKQGRATAEQYTWKNAALRLVEIFNRSL